MTGVREGQSRKTAASGRFQVEAASAESVSAKPHLRRSRQRLIIIVVVWRRRAIVWNRRGTGAHGVRRRIWLRPHDATVWPGRRRSRAGFEDGPAARREPGRILLQAGNNSARIRNLAAAEAPDIRRAGHLLLVGAAILLRGCRAVNDPAADQERKPQNGSPYLHVGALFRDEIAGAVCGSRLSNQWAAERFSPATKREAHSAHDSEVLSIRKMTSGAADLTSHCVVCHVMRVASRTNTAVWSSSATVLRRCLPVCALPEVAFGCREAGGKLMRNMGVLALCALLGGCVTAGETVTFRASNPQQQALMRDGQPALVSRQRNSLVLVRPASRQLQANGRPVFVIGINNLGRQPIDFRVGQVEAIQHVAGSDFEMKVVTYEMLVQEERSRQVAAALITGLAAGANAYGASRAGYGSYTTPSGRTGTFYSPTAAAIAQGNAAAQNDAMIAATVETGQRNMAVLEQSVIKDDTLLPGEWYGGQLHLAPPTDQGGGPKIYTIVITVGPDRHVVEISQGPAGA